MSDLTPDQRQHFERAQKFIKQGNYNKALQSLKPVSSHPAAQRWIHKIEELSIEHQFKRVEERKKTRYKGCITCLALMGLVSGCLMALFLFG